MTQSLLKLLTLTSNKKSEELDKITILPLVISATGIVIPKNLKQNLKVYLPNKNVLHN
jgi:hypothetical protein